MKDTRLPSECLLKKQRRQKEEASSRRRDMDGIAVFETRVSAQSADWVHSASEP